MPILSQSVPDLPPTPLFPAPLPCLAAEPGAVPLTLLDREGGGAPGPIAFMGQVLQYVPSVL